MPLGLPGWSTQNRSYFRKADDSDAWTTVSGVYAFGFEIRGYAVDQAAPAFQSATVNGTTLSVTFNENLDAGSLPAGSDFTVSGRRSGTGTTAISGAPVSVTLGSAEAVGETVTVTYSQPDSGGLRDLAANPVASFESQSETNLLQMTGSFKERGALNRILTLSEDEKQRGLITASAGNHGQAVAYHAGRLGLQATVVMPLPTPLIKVANTRGFGADVRLAGETFDDAQAHAHELEAELGATYVHPFNDAQVIADGIAVKRPAALTLKLVEELVDDLVTVDEEEIANAVLLLLEREKAVVEGAGAAVLAAVVNDLVPQAKGRQTAMVLTGGNIDVTLLNRIIERGLTKDGRLVQLDVCVRDRPGALATLLNLVGESGANVLETHHERAFSEFGLNEVHIGLRLETRGTDHVEELIDAIAAAGLHVRRQTQPQSWHD